MKNAFDKKERGKREGREGRCRTSMQNERVGGDQRETRNITESVSI